MKADYMHMRLASALREIVWKLNRKTKRENEPCEWAQIDINDAVIIEARDALNSYDIQAEE